MSRIDHLIGGIVRRARTAAIGLALVAAASDSGADPVPAGSYADVIFNEGAGFTAARQHIEDGTIVRICNRSPFHVAPFGLSQYNEFGQAQGPGLIILPPGQCMTHRANNPTPAPISMRINSALTAHALMILAVSPSRALAGGQPGNCVWHAPYDTRTTGADCVCTFGWPPRKADIVDPSYCQTVPYPGVEPRGTFEIANVEWPARIDSDGLKGDLTVTWSGEARFPVTMVYRPRKEFQCISGGSCGSPSQRFDTFANRLTFKGAVWCTALSVPSFTFDYEVVLIDANRRETPPKPAAFECKGKGPTGVEPRRGGGVSTTPGKGP